MKEYRGLTYSQSGQLLDLYCPDSECRGILLYFHGGGLTSGSREKVGEVLASYLVPHGYALASADYRLFPDAAYPDFLNDAADAAAWTFAHAEEYGFTDRVFIGGSSAGGYISMMLCFDREFLESRGIYGRPAGYIHDAGQPTKHFQMLENEGLDRKRQIIDETAPLYYVGLEENYPPMLFIVSDDDMANRYEQTMLMISSLRNFGHTEPDVQLRVMHGKHCKYVRKLDENNESILGKIAYGFMSSFEK